MDIGIGVPAPPESFVGRQQELDYLAGWLRPGRSLALVAEPGTTGVGRTALARAFAHRTQAFKGVLGWTLQADGQRPHAALRRWALRLGAPIKGRASLGQLLEGIAAALKKAGPVLVIIDGVRGRDLAVVRRLITALPADACILLTVDERKAAERLELRTLEIAPLSDEEGIEMLEVVIGSPVPSIIAGAMLQAVGYLPLGIVLAGSRMRQATAEESGSWGGEVDPRRAARMGGPVGVARSFLDAYRRLGEGTARVLRATGMFAHGAIHAERLGALLGLDVEVAQTELERLAGYGIIEPLEADAWMSHPLVSGYAMRLLEESGDLDRLQKRRLALVLQSEGVPGGGLTPSDILDVVHRAMDRGDLEDMVALATRVGDELASWCLEGALALVGEARTRAQAGRNRALGILKTRHEALLQSASALGVKDEDIRLDGSEPEEEVFDVRPVNDLAAPKESAGAKPDEAIVEPLTEDAAPPARAPVAEPAFEPVVPTPKAAADNWWVVRPDTSEAAVAKKASEDWSAAPWVKSASQQGLRDAVAEVARDGAEPVAEAETTGTRAVRAIRRASGEGPDDARMYGASKHAATLRGDSSDSVRSDCLARARVAATAAGEIQDRLALRLEEGERDLRGRQDPNLRGPIDRVTSLTRSVVDQVRAARAAITVIEHAGDLERMRRAAERAERARDASAEAVSEADAIWTAFYDALSNLQESAARRRAAVQRARNDASIARTAVDDAALRVSAWQSSDPDVDWTPIEGLLASARAALARADAAFVGLDSASDPESASAVVGDARRDAERLARQVTAAGNKAIEAAREITRDHHVKREVGEHVDRIERDAIAFDTLRDGLLLRLGAVKDDSTAPLARRLNALTTRVNRGRKFAASEVASESTPERIERLAATARDVGACLAECEKIGVEVDAWSAAQTTAEDGAARLALMAEALTAVAAMESTAAVARRASSRAHGAAAGLGDAEVVRIVGQLEAQEVMLRDALDVARTAVDAIDAAPARSAAEAAAAAAALVVDAAQVNAERARGLAESLITLADARRASLLVDLREEGRALADRVIQNAADVSRMADEAAVLRAAAGESAQPWMDAIQSALVRVNDASSAAEEGERRLAHYGDPGVLGRVIDTMQDASDVASAAMIEVEVARVKLRGLAARATTATRAAVRTQPTFTTEEPTQPAVFVMPAEEPTPAWNAVEREPDTQVDEDEVSVALPSGMAIERTMPMVEVRGDDSAVLGEATVPSISRSSPTEAEAYWAEENTSDLLPGTLPAARAERTVPMFASGAGDDDDRTSPGLPPSDGASDGASDGFDDFESYDSVVTDADRAEAEAAVAWAGVRAARARSAFDGARRSLTDSSDRSVWASLVEGRSMLGAEAARLDAGIEAVHGRLACAHRVSFVAEAVIRLASEFGTGALPPEVRRDTRARTERVVSSHDPSMARDLARWEVAVEAWSAGWTEVAVLDARDVARVAMQIARRALPGDRTDAHRAARDAVDALAATIRSAAQEREIAWADVDARGAAHARAAWAALRAEDLSGALEQARSAAQISAVPEVRVAASLVLRALGRVMEAEACLTGVVHPLVERVRAVNAGKLPVDALSHSAAVALEARDAIH